MLPGTVAYVLFSSSLIELIQGTVSLKLIVGVALIIGVTLMPLVYMRIKKNKKH
jgi:uncharacterized membrane protein YdjX (TVP38/TMEM64 family)